MGLNREGSFDPIITWEGATTVKRNEEINLSILFHGISTGCSVRTLLFVDVCMGHGWWAALGDMV